MFDQVTVMVIYSIRSPLISNPNNVQTNDIKLYVANRNHIASQGVSFYMLDGNSACEVPWDIYCKIHLYVTTREPSHVKNNVTVFKNINLKFLRRRTSNPGLYSNSSIIYRERNA